MQRRFVFVVFLWLLSTVFGIPATLAEETGQRSSIRVAAAQLLTDTVDLEQNTKKISKAIRDASAAGCDIVLFHEGCLTGYPVKDKIDHVDFRAVREAEKKICLLAQQLGISVLLGSTGEVNGQYFNYVLVIDQKGSVLGTYDKTWRAGEPHYCAGEGPVIFRIAGIEATVIICHDLRYPELVRLAVAAGARIVFIANNESGITKQGKLLGYRSMQISRATENLVYSVMSNSPSDPKNVDRPNCSHGNSKIVGPLGNVLDEAGVFEERLVIADLNLDEATGGPAARTIGENPSTKKLYGVACENEAYAAWVKAGLKLVRRLDGSRVPAHLR